ncbi:hypothetical protein F4604DRAFT_1790849 [Suillus subluteus]|nr:hypothetical protein F4604DRAFT_1790849 [Suillus subluteus]
MVQQIAAMVVPRVALIPFTQISTRLHKFTSKVASLTFTGYLSFGIFAIPMRYPMTVAMWCMLLMCLIFVYSVHSC